MDGDLSDCMTREATVVEAGAEKVLLRIDHAPEEETPGCRCCAMKGLCRGREADVPVVAAPPAPEAGLAAGDRVAVRYRRPNPALASAVMFAPALCGLFAGGFAVWRLADGRDWAFLAGCLLGLAAGVGITFLANRYAPSLRPGVRIVGKI